MSYPGIYKARCISSNGGTSVDLYVPQLFGDVTVTTATFTGDKPAAGTDGWVAFEGADAAYPVWISAASGSGTSVTVTGGGSTISDNYQWRYDPSATMANPGAGNLRTNTPSGTPATQVAISTTTDRGVGVQDILRSLTVGDLIYFQAAADSASWGRYTISGAPVDNGAWFQLPVTQVEVHGTSIGKNQDLLLRFTYGQGVAGSSGVTTIAGTTNQVTASTPTGNVTLSLPQDIHTGATPTFTGLTTKKASDTNPRIRIDAEGNATWQSPLRAPFVGDHQVGAVGYGHDTQFYMERASNVSALLTLQMNRPGSLPGIEPAITSGNTFPVSGGSVTVADASELPSTTGGPYNLGTAVVELPSFTDDFNRANSTTTMGAPWTAIGGNVWGISGNAAYVATGSIGPESIVTMDTGAGSHEVSCTMGVPGVTTSLASHGSGIIFNCDGTNQNYLSIQFDNNNGVWNCFRRVNGTYTFMFNSGLHSSTTTIRAKVQPSGYLYVWFGDRAPVVVNLGTAWLNWHRAGLINIFTAAPPSTMTWDNFSVRTTAPCTWTGKTGNTLTGFNCPGLTGTATTSWTVNFADGTAGNLIAAYDGAGAPIWNLRAYGGQHTTDNVTMGGGLGAEVGMSFLSLGARTPPAVVFYGDAPPSGSGFDNGAGTFLRRDTPTLNANRIRSGGRIFIAPSDITSAAGVASAGTATAPHLGIGTADTGLYLKSTGASDTLGVAVDGAEVMAFGANSTLSSNLLFSASNTWDVGSIFAGARTVHASTDFWLAGKRIMYSTASPEGVRTAAVGSICLGEAGVLYLKKTGAGNTGWVALAEVGSGGGIAAGAVTTTEIADGTITNVDISTSAGIALSKLATVANNTVVGNVSGSTAAPVALTQAQLQTLVGAGTGITYVATYAALSALPSPTRGQRVWVDEAGYEYVYYGSTTGWQQPWNQPWGRIAAGTSTTDVTGISSAALSTQTAIVTASSVTQPANRMQKITGHVFFNASSGNDVRLFTMMNGGQQGVNRARERLDSTGRTSGTLYVTDAEATSNGSAMVWDLRAVTSTGTVTAACSTAAAGILIEDMGPTGWAPSI